MNYARLKDAIREFADRLANEFDVPNEAVDEIVLFAEQTAIVAETKAKNERQYEMLFREHGSKAVAYRLGITQQAARKRFNKIIGKPRKVLLVSP
ncbi:hypothetical protein [Dyella sp. SG609]|uniref:hypothetical protein n=1 Tax=Dyella sp. SG609 TaxID=2587018 RepID=UPI0014469BF8|nr:hypothetical protein [Dyella sp. SG609]NKJ21998.1 hypothetical protein [Dyella sp. SG609]